MLAHPSTLINETEAARRLGLAVSTLRRWRWQGNPPQFVKIGSAVRYDPIVIDDLITSGIRNSTSDRSVA
jgi:predicted DNA-binding transcriptional regulator AlpA